MRLFELYYSVKAFVNLNVLSALSVLKRNSSSTTKTITLFQMNSYNIKQLSFIITIEIQRYCITQQ